MNQSNMRRSPALGPVLLGLLLPIFALSVAAQEVRVTPVVVPPATTESASPPEANETDILARRPVGDATHDLLSFQREGRSASRTPRPITGDVATLSYQRYLKSFTHDIPLNFKSSVGQQGSSGK